MDTWAKGHGNTTVDEVANAISQWSTTADGITISGGEPFDQPDALFELLARIRSETEADILVFTGYPWASVSGMLAPSPSPIDALVTGPFDVNEKQTLALRGSDNQQLHLITDRGRARFAGFERLATKQDRAVDVMFDDNGDVWFAGVPARDDFRLLQELLEKTGSTLSTSEDKRVSSGQVRPT
jgi:anaerobic ribonucleoside-triphosphate reductase activating protein